MDRPTARLVERTVHRFAGLSPADRVGLLRLTAAQEGLDTGDAGPIITIRSRVTDLAWSGSSLAVGAADGLAVVNPG